jgi:hypothetical protein
VSAHSAGAYTATLLVMVNVVKGRGGAPTPSTSPAWANFSIMIECTPESDCCYSVYSVVGTTVNWTYNQSLYTVTSTLERGGGDHPH